MIKLSMLDQSPVSEGSTPVEALAQTAKLAQEAEELGYHRFWVSEHHSAPGLAGSSPEVLMAHLAAVTSTIRIGSGGVLLPHYSAYKVAENFRVLEGLYPGRIDLGIGRAPGGAAMSTRALQEYQLKDTDRYEQKVEDLITYLYDKSEPSHRFAGLQATPSVPTAPEIWLLGSSIGSSALAARLGTGFAFAQFINGEGGSDTMKGYKKSFCSSEVFSEPQGLIAVFVVCAETSEAADKLAASMDLSLVLLEKGHISSGTPSVERALEYRYTPYEMFRIQDNRKRMVVGSPESVRQQLEALAEKYSCNEIMIASLIHSFPDKLKSIRLVAEACGLPKYHPTR